MTKQTIYEIALKLLGVWELLAFIEGFFMIGSANEKGTVMLLTFLLLRVVLVYLLLFNTALVMTWLKLDKE